MKIILYTLNYSPELTGVGKYSGDMGAWLARRGHDVRVITAPPYFPEWEVKAGYRQWFPRAVRVAGARVYRAPLWVPKSPRAIVRLIHLFSFAVSSGLRLAFMPGWRPDVVILVTPTFLCAPVALFYARLKGCTITLHVQDFELDAMLGLGMAKLGFLGNLAQRLEGWFLRRFDMVSTISGSMARRAVAKGVAEDKAVVFPNWSDTAFVTPEHSGARLREEWGIGTDEKVVLYSGSIGRKQGLEVVLDAAQALSESHGARFVIVGTGTFKNLLRNEAQRRGLDQVMFRELLPWNRVPELLAMADVHLVVQKRGAADVVLPSKLTNILSAGGHVVITAEAETELGLLCDQHPGIAVRVEPEDRRSFIAALRNLLEAELPAVNTVARDYALTHLNREAVLRQFEEHLLQVCGKGDAPVGKPD